MSFSPTVPDGQSELPQRRRLLQVALCILGIGLVFGVALESGSVPLLPFAAIGGAMFLFICFSDPLLAFRLFLFIHIAVPIYMRLPRIGPIPPAPFAGAMWPVLAITAFLSGKPVSYRGLERYFVAAFLLFTAIAALSLVDPRTEKDGIDLWLRAIFFPLIVFFTANRVMRSAADADRAFRTMLWAGSIVAAYGVVEFIRRRNPLMETFLLPLVSDLSSQYRAELLYGPSLGLTYRSFSVFSNVLEYGNCMGIIYPYALARFFMARRGRERVLFAAATGICALGIAVTVSRGPILAMAVSTIAIPALLRPPILADRRFLAGTALAAIVALVVGWSVFGTALEGRFDDSDNVTLRFKEWEAAADMFADHPWLGVGFGNFPEYQIDTIRAYRIGPIFEIGDGDADSGPGLVHHVVENSYLQLAAETGLLGMLAFLALVGALLAIVLRLVQKHADPVTRTLGASIGAGFLSYLVNGLTVTAYTHYISTMLAFAVLFAAAVVVHRAQREAREARVEAIEVRRVFAPAGESR